MDKNYLGGENMPHNSYRESTKKALKSNLDNNRAGIIINEARVQVYNEDTDKYKEAKSMLKKLWSGVNVFLDKWLSYKLPLKDEHGNDVPYEE